MHLNKHIFSSHQLQKYLAYEAQFFQNIGYLMWTLKIQKKMPQKINGFIDNLI